MEGTVTISTTEYMELVNKANMHESYIREIAHLHRELGNFHRNLDEVRNKLYDLEQCNK